MSLRLPGNFKANDSELIENHEEMLSQYYMDSDIFSWYKSPAT